MLLKKVMFWFGQGWRDTQKHCKKQVFETDTQMLNKNIVKTAVFAQSEVPLESSFQKHRKTEGLLVACCSVFPDVFERNYRIHRKNTCF